MSPLQRLRSIRDQRKQRRRAEKTAKKATLAATPAAELQSADDRAAYETTVAASPPSTAGKPSPRKLALQDVQALQRERKKKKALDEAAKAAEGGE